jgi:hypothetical protein
MARFSISDAAFSGFRLVGARPQILLTWTVLLFLVSLGMTAAMSVTFGPALMQLQSATPQSRADPAQAVATFRALGSMYALFLPVSLVYYGVLYATMNRAVLKPQDSGFAYLRLGGDEFRQIGLMLLYIVVALGAYIAVIVAVAVLSAVIVGIFSAGGRAGAMVASGLVFGVTFLGILVAAIYFAVRLSLASAETFATRKITLFGSWALSRGHFWPMLGAYVIASILAVIVFLLGMSIAAALMAVVGGVGSLASLVRPDISSVSAALAPPRLIYLAVMAVISALTLPVMFAPPATIYRALKGEQSTIDGVFE